MIYAPVETIGNSEGASQILGLEARLGAGFCRVANSPEKLKRTQLKFPQYTVCFDRYSQV